MLTVKVRGGAEKRKKKKEKNEMPCEKLGERQVNEKSCMQQVDSEDVWMHEAG
jgi:hypothetical protein